MPSPLGERSTSDAPTPVQSDLTSDIADYLRSTEFLDHEHPAVSRFADEAAGPSGSAVDRIVRLYYAVRDGLAYEVYDADLSRRGLVASTIVSRGRGFCLQKSILFAAAARRLEVPSRLVFADVRNHLASDRLQEVVGGDVFHHCLAEVHLEGRWVKATPVFNRLLCQLYGMKPLEFDGLSDSLYHPFDQHGRQHMEFLRHYGHYDDVPYNTLIARIREMHPRMLEGTCTVTGGSLLDEAPTGKSA